MDIDFDGAIDLYLDHVKVERGLGRNTVEAYAFDLQHFRTYCERQRVTIDKVESRQLLGYLAELSSGTASGASKLAVRSQARRLVALRGFFRYLRAERYLSLDPTQDIELPRLGRPLPKMLRLDEIERLLAQPDRTSPRGLRDAA